MKKLLFIINPKAGLKKNRHFVDEAVSIFEQAGYKVGIKYTKKRGDATIIAKDMSDKADLVVCMGGDGTLNEVMQGIMVANTQTPLGYIPAGSTNDFAASLGLKSNPKEQAKFIVSNEPRPLDLGCFNGRYFVYTASAGVFTKTSYSTPQDLKNKIGHLAYVIMAVRELFSLRRLKLKVELDDKIHEGKYIFVAINNATRVGGVMKLDESLVRFNDGLFELMLVEYPKDAREFLQLIIKVLTRKFTGKITLEQIKSARITDSSDIDWSLDGEKEKGRTIVEFEVVHDAIDFIY